jgi:hypothetical protein
MTRDYPGNPKILRILMALCAGFAIGNERKASF